jgi:hypothetical protein
MEPKDFNDLIERIVVRAILYANGKLFEKELNDAIEDVKKAYIETYEYKFRYEELCK